MRYEIRTKYGDLVGVTGTLDEAHRAVMAHASKAKQGCPRPLRSYDIKDNWESTEAQLRTTLDTVENDDLPECPGPDCPACSGAHCDICGTNPAIKCEHDVVERHFNDRVSIETFRLITAAVSLDK